MHNDHNVVRFTWRNHRDRDAMLSRLVEQYRLKPQIRMQAMRILKDAQAPERNIRAQARALFLWMRRNIPYHMEAGEQVVLPGTLLSLKTGGDCDDQSLALASLLASLAIPVRFNYWRKDGPINHVSVGVYDGARWFNVDPILDQGFELSPAGYRLVPGRTIEDDQRPARASMGMIFDVVNEPGQALPKLGGVQAGAGAWPMVAIGAAAIILGKVLK